MSFINKSVNYSQTNLLKTKYLSQLLHNYNSFLINEITNNNSLTQLNYYIIPNNNTKFYLYINKKKILENCKENYNILYFFPSDDSKSSDFFIEIDNKFNSTFLFEGYIYKKDNKSYYLLTDILFKDQELITCDYALRYTMLNEIFFNITNLSNLNDHLTIGIHPIFQNEHENIIHIFLHNFIHKQDICSVEHVYNFKKIQIHKESPHVGEENKKIGKGKYPDVYNVYNLNTGNNEGILYIKGLKESKCIKNIISNVDDLFILKCKYNSTFHKWEPILH